MKKKKLTVNKIKIIINIIGLLVFCVSYFYVYHKYEAMAETTNQQIEGLKQDIKDRKQKLANESTMKEKLAKVKEQKKVIFNSFPVQIAKEDNFMFVKQMEDTLKIKFSTIDMTDSIKMYQTIVPIQKNSGEEKETASISESNVEQSSSSADTQTMIGMKSTVNLTFLTTYNNFKKLVDYISQYPDRSMIESASVGYDNATGKLTGSLVINRYALTGTGKVYEPPYIKNINIGTDNIFGSVKNKKKKNK